VVGHQINLFGPLDLITPLFMDENEVINVVKKIHHSQQVFAPCASYDFVRINWYLCYKVVL